MHGNIDIYGDDFDPVSIFAQFANKLTQRAFANKGWILNYLNLESLYSKNHSFIKWSVSLFIVFDSV